MKAQRVSEWADWAKNPDVIEVQERNREAKQSACKHPSLMGSGWSARCAICFKDVPYFDQFVAEGRT